MDAKRREKIEKEGIRSRDKYKATEEDKENRPSSHHNHEAQLVNEALSLRTTPRGRKTALQGGSDERGHVPTGVVTCNVVPHSGTREIVLELHEGFDGGSGSSVGSGGRRSVPAAQRERFGGNFLR
ncbi:hypothetical protein DFH09DRAFT_1081945 [Mycena vulgaris]|nr:hypothetical protein DFH09DRAFT_1081945 [Mycena vulgaris]